MKNTKKSSVLLIICTLLLYFVICATTVLQASLPNDTHDQAHQKLVQYRPSYILNNDTSSMIEPQLINRQNIGHLIFLFDHLRSQNTDSSHEQNTYTSSSIEIKTEPDTTTRSSTSLKTTKKTQNTRPATNTSKTVSDKINKNDQSIILDKYNGKENVIDEDELFWLARIIEAEASGEPYQGKLAVGSVIINRKNSENYPSTIYGVIFDNKYGVQFTPTSNGTIYNEPSDESYKAAKELLSGIVFDNEILYFVNHDLSSSTWFESKTFVFKIGKHTFYK